MTRRIGALLRWACYLCALAWTPAGLVIIPATVAAGHWVAAAWFIFCWPFNIHLAVRNTRNLWNAEPIL